ncbi:MAG: hypothetical protein IPQ02_03240 [Saprospiraceae bacterium]|uniref:Rod shape-determining protein MreD n=1 Tax=Candidatus Defluviibacterium haderslevense TaxID=2981993 RepID=A0A9D7SAU5_9BACT|nr:hypothetical protein [Candidatus Defluviibacterium haderslevense]MBL0235647.1 hypothetical protein [Candidatus Defluviibacterium haderslevense]
MNSIWVVHIIRFILLLAFQVLILKGINLSESQIQYVTIIVYPVAVLLLPIALPQFFILVIAFCSGIFVDLFYGTIGVHASACLWMASVRPIVLKYLEPKSGYSVDQNPNSYNLGIFWFLQYASLLMGVYIFCYFILEVFTFVYFGEILIKTLLSFVVSIFIIFIMQILINSKN